MTEVSYAHDTSVVKGFVSERLGAPRSAWHPRASFCLAPPSLGWLVAGSFSWDNTYEIVGSTAPWTGTYTFQIRKDRCTVNPYWLRWAWPIVP